MNEVNLDSTPCSLRYALGRVQHTIQSLHAHTAKHGAPAEVVIPESWVLACEKPFPLSEGNLAKDAIEFSRIEQEMEGRLFSMRRDQIKQTIALRVDAKNKAVPEIYED